MTPEHDEHLNGIHRRLTQDLYEKYRRGQAEHGGKLWESPGMLRELRNELIDLITYEDTLAYQLGEIRDLLGAFIRMVPDPDTVDGLMPIYEKLDHILGKAR
mgnify:CR=1 FL=1